MKKIEVHKASTKVLDWAIAMITGRVLPRSFTATDDQVKGLKVPFTMYEVSYTYRGGERIKAEVKPIHVHRYGCIRERPPSIDFLDAQGNCGTGSVTDFFLTAEAAQAEASGGEQVTPAGFTPTSDWNVGGPLIDQFSILFTAYRFSHSHPKQILAYPDRTGADPSAVGATRLEAAMRCIVAMQLGSHVEVPDELVDTPEAQPA